MLLYYSKKYYCTIKDENISLELLNLVLQGSFLAASDLHNSLCAFCQFLC